MTKRHSFEYVKEYFEAQGCRLLSGEYVNNHAPLSYQCSCGNQATVNFSNFQQGQRCNKCKNKRVGKSKIALTIAEVHSIFEANRCKLLSNEYHGIDHPLDYICSCGKRSRIRLKDLIKGTRCKECLRRELSRSRKGKNNPAWKENKTWQERQKDRSFERYKLWRTSVYRRDNYTCCICSAKKNLNAHHLCSFAANEKLRTAVNNGITLCKKCHMEFHDMFGRKNNSKEQFETFLLKKKAKVILLNPYQATIFDCAMDVKLTGGENG